MSEISPVVNIKLECVKYLQHKCQINKELPEGKYSNKAQYLFLLL